MKKYVTSVLIFVLALSSALAATRPQMRYQVGMVYFASRGITRDTMAYSTEFNAQGSNYSGTFGFQAYSDIIDFSLTGDFFPRFCTWEFTKRYIKIGFRGVYHFQNQVNLAYESDFILTSIFSIASKKNFTIEIDMGYGVKASQIKAVKDEVGWIYDALADTTIILRKKFDSGADVFASFSSHDLYQYPTFISPIYTVGGAYTFKTNFRPYCEISARMCDMYVTAPYLDRLQFKLGIGYSF
ncbi:MAG: hypothetical protein II921_06910 [Treponema sp.]|nr:hypothetical protein [Treponema sp.]